MPNGTRRETSTALEATRGSRDWSDGSPQRYPCSHIQKLPIGRILDKVEGSPTIGQHSAQFAVKIAVLRRKPSYSVGDGRVFVCPEHCPGESGCALCPSRPGMHPIPIELDFVQPVGAVRCRFNELGKLRFDRGRWRSQSNPSADGDRAHWRRRADFSAVSSSESSCHFRVVAHSRNLGPMHQKERSDAVSDTAAALVNLM
jgi:hypothetical protein